ncbi:MAG: hypothetical protein E7090_06170 [Bacteroidales bacterium]|nr:hypothetical protein [Bacteroidales bacterium]
MNWLKSWQWFGKAETLQLFLYLLVNANTEDRYWQGILVKRGQIVVTIPMLVEVLDSTVQKVRTNLERLSTSHEINRQVTNKYSIITICNYDSYIDVKTDNQQTTNKQLTDTKEIKKENIPPIPPIKEKNKEKYSSSSSSACACACEENFIEFFKRDRIWGEVVEMRYGLQPNSISKWINDFSLDLQCRDVAHKNLQDAKRHFCDWLRIQLKEKKYEQKTHSTGKAEHIAAERERIMREIASAGNIQDDTPSWLE